MFKHILLAVDGSDASRLAVDKALALAKAFDSEVTLIYVIDLYAFTGVGTDFSYGQTEYINTAKDEAQEVVGAARQVFESNGVAVKGLVVEAHSVYQAILDAAHAARADMVVMGSHGRHGLEKLVLGSVTSQVLSHAHLSVLVVRE